MTFLSISEETGKSLGLLRHQGETDDDLVKRILELARAHMIVIGMEDTND